MTTITAEHARTPHDPRLSAYEAGRWYALHDRSSPCGATRECLRGYYHVLFVDCVPDDCEEAR